MNGPGDLRAQALLVYVVAMPFMSALAPAAWLPWPLILVLVAAPWLALRRDGPSLARALRDDAGFIVAFVLGALALVWSPLPLGGKNLNYAAAVLASYLLFFVAVRSWLCGSGVTTNWLGVCAHRCLTLLSLAIIVEFFLASFAGVFYADLIPFAHSDLNVADLVTEDFKRPRAFAPEPGFTALAFDCLWPLTLLARRSRWRHALYGIAFLLLASAASMVAFAVAAAAIWMFRSRNLRALLAVVAIAALLSAAALLTDVGSEIAWTVLGRKFDVGAAVAAEPTGDAVTVIDRVSTYLIGWQLLVESPLGIGWGSLAEAYATGTWLTDIGLLRGSGMLSLYLDVAVAAGFGGVLAFGAFVGLRVSRMLRSDAPGAIPVTFSVLAVLLHHALVTEFQFPFLWFALAVADRFVFQQGRASLKHGAGVEYSTAHSGAPASAVAPTDASPT